MAGGRVRAPPASTSLRSKTPTPRGHYIRQRHFSRVRATVLVSPSLLLLNKSQKPLSSLP